VASIASLQPEHADSVWELSQQAYPGSFHLSRDDIRETLADLTPADNFCFGAFQEGVLVGYLMCWLDISQVEEREGEVVLLLDDIVVTETSRIQLIALLRALRRAIVSRGKTDLAIEGTHRQRAEALFNAHPRVVELLGYRQAATHHYFGEREQETLCWARYEPVAKP
jgi:hypothetical protein